MNELPLLMEEMPLETVLNIFFQHGRASAYFGNRITAYLNQHYKIWWIGHAGSVPLLIKAMRSKPLQGILNINIRCTS
jgi:bisphosphoglycerate-dependent phosphoglycerate mutase